MRYGQPVLQVGDPTAVQAVRTAGRDLGENLINRLRKEAAGSGALGDLGSHAVDQVQHLLGEPVTSVNGTMRT
jgi:predicted dehydrogenase